jgi:hypothetical protein
MPGVRPVPSKAFRDVALALVAIDQREDPVCILARLKAQQRLAAVIHAQHRSRRALRRLVFHVHELLDLFARERELLGDRVDDVLRSRPAAYVVAAATASPARSSIASSALLMS